MQITVFGVFWLIILLIGCLKGQRVLIKCVIFSSLFQAGAVFIIAGKSLDPFTVSCVTYIIFSICKSRFRCRFHKPLFFNAYSFFIAVLFLTSIVASLLFTGMTYMECVDWVQYETYDGHIAWFGIITLVIYGITLLICYNEKLISREEITHLFDYMVLFVLFIGVWQYLSIMKILPRNDFIRDFIYSNSTTTDNISYFTDTNASLRIYSSLFGIRFYGPFMEPSYCAGFLAMAFANYVSKSKITKRDIVLIVCILCMAVMTFSATAYVGVAFAGVLSAFMSGKVKVGIKVVFRGTILIVIALALITYFNLWDTVNRLIINKADTHSAYIRGLWNTNALKTFWDTYGIGLGYANVRGSSLIFTIPASTGILGDISFIYYNYKIVKTGRTSHERGLNIYQIMYASVLFAMCVAISVLNYSIFWMSAIILVLGKHSETDKTPLIDNRKNRRKF